MTVSTTVAPLPQSDFLALSLTNDLRPNISSKLTQPTLENHATDLVSRIAGCSLVIASAGFGAVYAWSTGSHHGVVLGSLSVLFAVALEVCKPLALGNALTAVSQFNVVRGTALIILAAMAVVYSITAELSLWSAMRTDGIAERQTAINVTVRGNAEARRKDDQYEAAKKELAEIAPARTSAEVQAEITTLLAANPRAGDCSLLDGKVTRAVCPQVEVLKAEAARGEKREALKQEMATAGASTTTLAPDAATPMTADPGATAIATYLNALGFGKLDVNALSEWLGLVPVLALEVGSLFAGLLCPAPVRTRETAPAQRCSLTVADEATETPATTVPNAVFSGCVQSAHNEPEKLNVSDCPGERLLDLLKSRAFSDEVDTGSSSENATKQKTRAPIRFHRIGKRSSGGEVFGGQRTFAKAVNVSPAHVNGLLHDLAASGRISLDVGRNGTRVKLVA